MDSKYVTVQWNSTDPARNISSLLIDNIHGDLKNKGYEVVDIGEDPTTPLAKLSKILYNSISGDINSDNSINILDVVLLVNIILGIDQGIGADINQDGDINIIDVVQLINIILE